MRFKGSQGKWGCVFTTDKRRAVRNKGGLICILTKPSRYSGQDDRYDRELEENLRDQRLLAAAPELLEALQELLIHALENDLHSEFTENAKEAINKALL